MDQTSFFRQCVRIYEEEFLRRDPSLKEKVGRGKQGGHHHSKLAAIVDFSPTNAFVKDSVEVNSTINELNLFIKDIQKEYQLWNSKRMPDKAKDEIDYTFKLQLGMLHKRVAGLQEYAELLNKRSQEAGGISLGHISRNLATMGEYGQYIQIESDTVCEMRLNVVKALGIRLTKVSDSFVALSSKRLARKKEHDRSYLETNVDYRGATPGSVSTSTVPFSIEMDKSSTSSFGVPIQGGVSETYQDLNGTLEPQQLQQLSKENEDLQLRLKDENLESVTKVEGSVVEVSSMINEIALQLNLQNDSLNTLSGFQDDIMSNVTMGNKQLVKANDRAKDSGRNLSYLIIILGVLLLLVDYIL
ncbi:DEKNAAC103882 [Brettanomyces naardenensis]|uniref:DEKNAAC103882 n=1 Tax=Brettanomyces naardenensis TaxID=13370 RepID=A0A448YPL2_BRENA|nr:DEKNAAC103882 [Brettanomyces naardenensis]